jgi:ribosomal protein S18 acetylase RimI-like enzyme
MVDFAPRLRPAAAADALFLREMVREADRWRLPVDAPRPPLDVVLADSHVSRYADGWGRPGDGGAIAEVGVTPVGACWLRLFTAEHHGWGFVRPDVPEISLAVAPAWRRRGVGTLLLAAAVEQARKRGCPAVSLSVQPDNPARVLYERIGFRRVATVDDGTAAGTRAGRRRVNRGRGSADGGRADRRSQAGAHHPVGT